jgi:hypothetical protein
MADMVLHIGVWSVLGSPCAGEEVDRQGKQRTVVVDIRPQPRKADGGGHTRWRQMAVAFGGDTWLLAVCGRFPASEAAGSGI